MDEGFIYLDNHATTRCDPRVVEAMLPYFAEEYGNPHSTTHPAGRQVAERLAAEIDAFAALTGSSAEAWTFTSGATESNNLALLGVMLHPRQRKRHLVSLETEHPAILDPLTRLEKTGFEITRLPVRPQGEWNAGQVDLDQLRDAVRDDTALVSIMWANNEIGVLQPLAEIADIVHRRGALLHTDAAQAVGKVALNLQALPVDLLSVSAHKFYGPKGVGALFVRPQEPRIKLLPQIDGGGQQHGLRSGTLNVPGIVGLVAAYRLAHESMPEERKRLTTLRDQLWRGLANAIPGIDCNGPQLNDRIRLPGNLNVCFPSVEGESMMMATPEIAISSGSACSSADARPSHVLLGLGLTEAEARRSVRFGLGRFTTASEIERTIERLAATHTRLAKLLV